MNMFLKVLTGCLILALAACNKTGAYGFKEGQIYTTTGQDINGNKTMYYYKVVDAGVDYIIFAHSRSPHKGYKNERRYVDTTLLSAAKRFRLLED